MKANKNILTKTISIASLLLISIAEVGVLSAVVLANNPLNPNPPSDPRSGVPSRRDGGGTRYNELPPIHHNPITTSTEWLKCRFKPCKNK